MGPASPVRLWYILVCQDIPQHCDGCGVRMMVNHALLCKARGLVHIRHDDVADEWHTYVPLPSHQDQLNVNQQFIQHWPSCYQGSG